VTLTAIAAATIQNSLHRSMLAASFTDSSAQPANGNSIENCERRHPPGEGSSRYRPNFHLLWPGLDARSPCLRRQGAAFESRLRINAAADWGGMLRFALSSVSAT
jgi:hypothetical protein